MQLCYLSSTKIPTFAIRLSNGRDVLLSCTLFIMFLFFSLIPLITKLDEYQVDKVVKQLCLHFTSTNQKNRDIASIGIKKILTILPTVIGATLPHEICGQIVTSLITANDKASFNYVLIHCIMYVLFLICS